MIIISGSKGHIGSALMRELWGRKLMGFDKGDAIPDKDDGEPLIFIDAARYKAPSEQFKIWDVIIQRMIKRGHGGKIILFSSIYGHKAPRFEIYPGTEIPETTLEYAMWKGATEQAVRYLAQKLKPHFIQVNAIAPGGVINGQSDKFQDKYRAAGANTGMIVTANLIPVVEMLIDGCAVNGQIITVDHGWSL